MLVSSSELNLLRYMNRVLLFKAITMGKENAGESQETRTPLFSSKQERGLVGLMKSKSVYCFLLSVILVLFLFGITGIITMGAIIFEAEEGVLEGTAVSVEAEGFSEGKFVTGIGRINRESAEIGSVSLVLDMTLGGDYTFRLCYCSTEERMMKIGVNDAAPVEIVCIGAEASAVVEVQLTLDPGLNIIRFFNDQGPAPDLDWVTVE